VQFVVSDLPTHELLALAPGRPSNHREIHLGDPSAPEGRFVVSIVVRDEGVPAALGVESFLLPGQEEGQPGLVVHLQRLDGMSGVPGAALLVAEAILEERGALRPEVAREAVLATVERFLPFVERHYVLVDSPNDGRPLWDFRGGSRSEVDRSKLRAGGAALDAEAMAPLWAGAEPGFLGLPGEPVRGALSGVFSVGKSVMPALGQEGELLVAWSASRIITRTDRRKEKMRREMWSKVELG
jgi:hypothetical protein